MSTFREERLAAAAQQPVKRQEGVAETPPQSAPLVAEELDQERRVVEQVEQEQRGQAAEQNEAEAVEPMMPVDAEEPQEEPKRRGRKSS